MTCASALAFLLVRRTAELARESPTDGRVHNAGTVGRWAAGDGRRRKKTNGRGGEGNVGIRCIIGRKHECVPFDWNVEIRV